MFSPLRPTSAKIARCLCQSTTVATRSFALKRTTTRRPVKRASAAPPPPALSPALAWEPVKDPATGQFYYWNTVTNETTHVGAPNPALVAQGSGASTNVAQQQQGGSGAPGLGSVMAQGMAFGVGSSIAHHAVGSLMGGGSHGHSGGGGAAEQQLAPPMDDGGGDFDSDFDL